MSNQNEIKLFFDEELHKYTDEYGNTYTSVTTYLGDFSNKFDVDTMARNCARAGRKGNPKYVGKTEAMLKAQWSYLTKIACDAGNEKHSFLETAIKQSTGYTTIGQNKYIKGRIHTIPSILNNPSYGRIDYSYFLTSGIKDKYPTIYQAITILHNQGFSFYAEIGVFSISHLISGLIDLLAIKGNLFYIIDWKTNKAPIRWEAGYYEKDNFGNLTDSYRLTMQKMKKPISHLEDSTGNKYGLQLNMYAGLTERFTVNDKHLQCIGILLCHIRKPEEGNTLETVKIHIMPFMKHEINDLLEHRNMTFKPKRQTQFMGFLTQ